MYTCLFKLMNQLHLMILITYHANSLLCKNRVLDFDLTSRGHDKQPFFSWSTGGHGIYLIVYIYMYLLDVFLFRDEMSMVAQISGSLFCS